MSKIPQESPIRKNAFVHKLYAMLNNPKLTHLIWWTNNTENNTFALHPGKEFANALTEYFKHGNVASFVRQLHMYGFHKVSDPSQSSNNDKDNSPIWEFKHLSGKFKKDDESSLVYIKRRSGNTRSSYSNTNGGNGINGDIFSKIHQPESLVMATSSSPGSFDTHQPYYQHQYLPNNMYYHHMTPQIVNQNHNTQTPSQQILHQHHQTHMTAPHLNNPGIQYQLQQPMYGYTCGSVDQHPHPHPHPHPPQQQHLQQIHFCPMPSYRPSQQQQQHQHQQQQQHQQQRQQHQQHQFQITSNISQPPSDQPKPIFVEQYSPDSITQQSPLNETVMERRSSEKRNSSSITPETTVESQHQTTDFKFRKIWDDNRTIRPRKPSLLFDPLASTSTSGQSVPPTTRMMPSPRNTCYDITTSKDSINSKLKIKLPPLHRSITNLYSSTVDNNETKLPRITANSLSSTYQIKTETTMSNTISTSMPGSPLMNKESSLVPINNSNNERLKSSLVELPFYSSRNSFKTKKDSIGYKSYNLTFSNKSSYSPCKSTLLSSISHDSLTDNSKNNTSTGSNDSLPNNKSCKPLSPLCTRPMLNRILTPPPNIVSKLNYSLSNQLQSPIPKSATSVYSHRPILHSLRSLTNLPLSNSVRQNENENINNINTNDNNSANMTNVMHTIANKKVSINSLLDTSSKNNLLNISSIINVSEKESTENEIKETDRRQKLS